MMGISFHVGSGCMDPPVYAKAIEKARKLFDFAKSVGYHFTLVDIGGGFPGDNDTSIKEVYELCAHNLSSLVSSVFCLSHSALHSVFISNDMI